MGHPDDRHAREDTLGAQGGVMASPIMNGDDRPTITGLAELVRQRLALDRSAVLDITEVTEHTNLNYVFRVRLEAESLRRRSFYVKVATRRPKRLDTILPRERVLYEADAIRRFKRLAGGAVDVPEVLFVDTQRFVLGLSDVGQGRCVLLERLKCGVLPGGLAGPLGTALGRVHRRSRGMAALRSREEEGVLRMVIFGGLLAPGAQRLFPESWPAVLSDFLNHEESLVHGDLWGKNLLVGPDGLPALVDFEGAHIGDPAFDVGTVLAALLIPVLEEKSLIPVYATFVTEFLAAYSKAAEDEHWAAAAACRACRYVGTFLAARGFGPFPYPLSDETRDRLAQVACDVTREPVEDGRGLVRTITRICG